MIQIVGALLLVFVSVFLWALNLIGLPGNWLVIAAVSLYAYFTPAEARADVGWSTVLVLVVLGLIGEAVEFVAGSLGAKKAGGSRRSAVLALCGSMVGGLFGLTVALPIPIIGSVVDALLFGGLGALGGAVLGEQWKGRTIDDSLRVGESAFWGRIFGTFGKAIIGGLLLAVMLVSLVL